MRQREIKLDGRKILAPGQLRRPGLAEPQVEEPAVERRQGGGDVARAIRGLPLPRGGTRDDDKNNRSRSGKMEKSRRASRRLCGTGAAPGACAYACTSVCVPCVNLSQAEPRL